MSDRYVSLSPARKLVGDFLHAGRALYLLPVQKKMHLSELVAARAAAQPRPSWCSLFVKALAAVAARRAQLRRSYVGFPWPRLFEHGENRIAVVVSRQWQAEDVIFTIQLKSPELLPVTEIDAFIRAYKERPIEQISFFRNLRRVAMIPTPLRRLLMWTLMNCFPRLRARILGTSGISVIAGNGAAGFFTYVPWTTSIMYDCFQEDGSIDVRLTFDHRVFDGILVARSLQDMEDELLGPILAEVRQLGGAARAA